MAIVITSTSQLKTSGTFNEYTDTTKNITFSSNFNIYCNEFIEDDSFYFEKDGNGNYKIHCTELVEE